MNKYILYGILGIFVIGVFAVGYGWTHNSKIYYIEGELKVSKDTIEAVQEAQETFTSCVVGGCSGQLCLDNKESKGVSTTCEWKEEYGCYKTAQCAVQSHGQCGWTPTPDLEKCLDEARKVSLPADSPQEIPSAQEDAPQEDLVESVVFLPNVSVKERFMNSGFKVVNTRLIDTVILHSSYNSLGGDKYDVGAIVDIYASYGVSAHYVIDRGGKIYQLVAEHDIAYHAGVASLPDGRTDVNATSIGIELLNDDKGDEYTDKQYTAVNALLADIQKRHTIHYILGHDEVAPKRKTDPWNFDWSRVER